MIEIQVASENAFIVYFREGSLVEKNAQVVSVVRHLDSLQLEWLTELIPAFDSILVIYDALRVDHLFVHKSLHLIAGEIHKDGNQSILKNLTPAKQIVLPVYYSPPVEHDINRIAQLNGLQPQDVIELHHGQTYQVFCLGFAPGFGFLGEVDQRIETPRLDTPRKKVPAGAVAIADRQTAIYPNTSPGGWNILGLCPSILFDPESTPATALSIGDSVQFVPIDKDEFIDLGGKF